MFKKICSIILCLAMLLTVVGCGGGDPTVEEVSSVEPSSSEPPPEPTYYINPLTGEKNLTEAQKDLRPVAVMINNINVAQPVQTGVQNADIIYETEVEGGITRLMAVFKDITATEDIGTIRSARYAYIDLAMGHDAVYVHCGIDPNYAAPYVKKSGVTDFDINSAFSAYGFRRSNGLAREHTMYSSSAKINQGISERNIRSTDKTDDTWASFRTAEEKTAPASGIANTATVKFSNSSTSIFTYNAETGLYTKNTKGRTNKDYKSGETYDVTNVFILGANMSNYAIAKYRKIDLTSGSGYYVSAGGYEPITWKKGSGSASFKFYAADGTELKVNPGKSWVCIHNKSFAPTFE